MAFKPLGKRILVEATEEVRQTASGIIIPDNAAKEKPQTGKAVAVSAEVSDIRVGDVVVFAKYSGSEITLDGKKFIVLSTEDVLGVVEA